MDSDDAGTEHVLDQAEDLTAAQRRWLLGAVACGGGLSWRLGGLPRLRVSRPPALGVVSRALGVDTIARQLLEQVLLLRRRHQPVQIVEVHGPDPSRSERRRQPPGGRASYSFAAS